MMTTRSLFSLVCLLAMAPMGFAADAPVRLMLKDKSNLDVLITQYGQGSVTYKKSVKDLTRVKLLTSKLDSIYFYEPLVFKQAMELYQGRKYAEAKVKFTECEAAFKSVETAPNNYATLAGFYVLECSRRQFDLKALSDEQKKFSKKALTRETQLQQLEVNAFWEAVRLKEWDRLDRLAQGWHKRKVPGTLRAQISYCHGLALAELAKKDPTKRVPALNAFNMALTADFTASSEIVIKAANHALQLYSEDEEVKLAMKRWGTPKQKKGSVPYQRLREANALAKLYVEGGFDVMKPMDPAHKEFLKYEEPKKETEKEEGQDADQK